MLIIFLSAKLPNGKANMVNGAVDSDDSFVKKSGNEVSSTTILSLYYKHGFSQQGVWVPFWTPTPLKGTPQDTQRCLCGISENFNLKIIIDFFHLLIIPMTSFNDIMPYFDEYIHVYG